VALEVIHAHQGQAVHIGERLRHRAADEERAHQPGPVGDRDAAEVTQADPGLGQRPRHHGKDVLEVAPRGQLRHHAAEGAMHLVLGGDDLAQHLAAAVEHGGGGLVARGLDAEYEHVLFAFANA
jgi:hypothetical protein